MSYGLEALDDVAREGSDDQEYKNIHAAMKKQAERLKDAVAEAVRLLEPPRQLPQHRVVALEIRK
jgi:hypothetical protein